MVGFVPRAFLIGSLLLALLNSSPTMSACLVCSFPIKKSKLHYQRFNGCPLFLVFSIKNSKTFIIKGAFWIFNGCPHFLIAFHQNFKTLLSKGFLNRPRVSAFLIAFYQKFKASWKGSLSRHGCPLSSCLPLKIQSYLSCPRVYAFMLSIKIQSFIEIKSSYGRHSGLDPDRSSCTDRRDQELASELLIALQANVPKVARRYFFNRWRNHGRTGKLDLWSINLKNLGTHSNSLAGCWERKLWLTLRNRRGNFCYRRYIE